MGKRTIGKGLGCDEGKKLLFDFKFTYGPKLRDILGPAAVLNKETGVLTAVAFDPKRLKFPKSNIHFSMEYGVLEYGLAWNAFRFMFNDGNLMFKKGDEAQELVLEVSEKLTADCAVFGIVKVHFHQQIGDRFYKSFAKGGIGVVAG